MTMQGYWFPTDRVPVDPANPPSSPAGDLQRAIYQALTGDPYLMTLINGVYDFVPEARPDIAGRELDPWGSVEAYVSFGPLDALNDSAECIESRPLHACSSTPGPGNAHRCIAARSWIRFAACSTAPRLKPRPAMRSSASASRPGGKCAIRTG